MKQNLIEKDEICLKCKKMFIFYTLNMSLNFYQFYNIFGETIELVFGNRPVGRL